MQEQEKSKKMSIKSKAGTVAKGKERMKYTIVKDTREQKGWNFFAIGDCIGMEVDTLKTGDYTIKGFEQFIAIERKRSVEEIANNLGRKSAAFEKEMQRMSQIPHAYIICEFNLQELLDFPKGAKVPASSAGQIKMAGPFMLRRLLEYEVKYNVKIMFCGTAYNGFTVANSLFKRIIDQIDGKL
jgi:hypothetical protein